MITLYGTKESRSFRALWALEEAQLEYKYQEIKLGQNVENGSQSNAYKAINYQGKVPALVHDTFIINESAAIVNYIAALAPQANLVPQNDIKLRGFYDEICFFVMSDLEQPLWNYGKHDFVLPEQYRIEAIKPVTHWEFEKSIEALQNYLGGNEFIINNQFTMADILIAHTLQWAIAFKFDVPQDLINYLNNLSQRPAFNTAMKRDGQA